MLYLLSASSFSLLLMRYQVEAYCLGQKYSSRWASACIKKYILNSIKSAFWQSSLLILKSFMVTYVVQRLKSKSMLGSFSAVLNSSAIMQILSYFASKIAFFSLRSRQSLNLLVMAKSCFLISGQTVLSSARCCCTSVWNQLLWQSSNCLPTSLMPGNLISSFFSYCSSYLFFCTWMAKMRKISVQMYSLGSSFPFRLFLGLAYIFIFWQNLLMVLLKKRNLPRLVRLVKDSCWLKRLMFSWMLFCWWQLFSSESKVTLTCDMSISIQLRFFLIRSPSYLETDPNSSNTSFARFRFQKEYTNIIFTNSPQTLSQSFSWSFGMAISNLPYPIRECLYFSSGTEFTSLKKSMPVRSSQRMRPALHTSHLSSQFTQMYTYGALYSGVPAPRVLTTSSCLASPKSAILMLSNSSSSRFAGFKSRCRIECS